MTNDNDHDRGNGHGNGHGGDGTFKVKIMDGSTAKYLKVTTSPTISFSWDTTQANGTDFTRTYNKGYAIGFTADQTDYYLTVTSSALDAKTTEDTNWHFTDGNVHYKTGVDVRHLIVTGTNRDTVAIVAVAQMDM